MSRHHRQKHILVILGVPSADKTLKQEMDKLKQDLAGKDSQLAAKQAQIDGMVKEAGAKKDEQKREKAGSAQGRLRVADYVQLLEAEKGVSAQANTELADVKTQVTLLQTQLADMQIDRDNWRTSHQDVDKRYKQLKEDQAGITQALERIREHCAQQANREIAQAKQSCTDTINRFELMNKHHHAEQMQAHKEEVCHGHC